MHRLTAAATLCDLVPQRLLHVFVDGVDFVALLEVVDELDTEFALAAGLQHFEFVHGKLAHWVVWGVARRGLD